MSNDIYCLRDGAFMVKISTGHVVKQSNDRHTEIHTRRGDLYRCEKCGFEVLGDFGEWR
jgi:hypothetical protein